MSRPKLTQPPARPHAPEGMGGLAKGLAIIEAFAGARGQLTVADAARAAGATRASARRCLLTLVELGYLEYDGKFFRPQPRMLRLGAAYSESRTLPQIAQPFLNAARDELQESISLAVLEDDHAVFIARAEAERLVSSGIGVGARAALYCTATGRVLLSALPEGEVRSYLAQTKLEPLTPKTIVKRGDLMDAVRAAGRDGYAISNEELELGLRSVAVPVFDVSKRLVGAMSASVASGRVSAAQMIEDFVPLLQRHAEKLGRAL